MLGVVDNQTADVYQEYLELLYEHITGFDEECDRDVLQYKREKVHTTYGELTHKGFRKLARHLSVCQDDVFYDFGSGVGKLVFQMFMQTDVKKAVGIEFHEGRAKDAQKALRIFKKELPEFFEDARTMRFIQGNFLKTPVTGATIVYICSTCFTNHLLKDIGVLLNKTASVHTVITLQPINNLIFPRRQEITVHCCWEKSTGCYIYTRDE